MAFYSLRFLHIPRTSVYRSIYFCILIPDLHDHGGCLWVSGIGYAGMMVGVLVAEW